MKIPRQIQAQLQSYYDLELHHRVDDYLITDNRLAAALEDNPHSRETSEKLLVREDRDGLQVSLYLEDDLLQSLDENNPFRELNHRNLAQYCTALEGVSHFVYLTFNATHDRPVSQLEMELQAEVDKFVSINLLADRQGTTLQWQELHAFLFTNCDFDEQLDSDDLERYQAASLYAAEFCSALYIRNGGTLNQDAIRTELCRFYRTRHRDKLSRCTEDSAIPSP